MPPQKGSSVLSKALGSDNWKKMANSNKDVDVFQDNGGDLPAGLNGIARITEFRIGTFQSGDNEGKPYFFAQATILKHNALKDGMLYKGKRTRVGPWAICDTPKSFNENRRTLEQNLAYVQAFVKAFLPEDVDKEEAVDGDHLETTIKEIANAGPTIIFRTWQSDPTEDYPNPRVNHTWGGLAEDVDVGSPESKVKDETSDEDEGSGGEETKLESGESGEEDLDELVQKAADEDEDAQNRLTELAVEAGKTKKWVKDEAEDWEEVVNVIREAQDEDGSGGEEDGGLEEGDQATWTYKEGKKSVSTDVEIVEMFEDGAYVKDTATGKVVKNKNTKKNVKVPLDQLEKKEPY